GWRTPLMRKRYPFDYAIVRIVPRVDRGEFLNAGVILFSSTAAFLDARIGCDHRRLKVLAPDIDTALIDSYLDSIPKVCAGIAEGEKGPQSDKEAFSGHVMRMARMHVKQCHTAKGPLSEDRRLRERPLNRLRHLEQTGTSWTLTGDIEDGF